MYMMNAYVDALFSNAGGRNRSGLENMWRTPWMDQKVFIQWASATHSWETIQVEPSNKVSRKSPKVGIFEGKGYATSLSGPTKPLGG